MTKMWWDVVTVIIVDGYTIKNRLSWIIARTRVTWIIKAVNFVANACQNFLGFKSKRASNVSSKHFPSNFFWCSIHFDVITLFVHLTFSSTFDIYYIFFTLPLKSCEWGFHYLRHVDKTPSYRIIPPYILKNVTQLLWQSFNKEQTKRVINCFVYTLPNDLL